MVRVCVCVCVGAYVDCVMSCVMGCCLYYYRGLLQNECLPWLREVTGLELNDHIDITCSKYEFTGSYLT